MHQHNIAEKSSTRVRQAPGGSSSIVFGDAAPQPVKPSRGKGPETPRRNPTLPESNPANNEKSSTRVLQNPGGKQNMKIGDTRLASPVKNGRQHQVNDPQTPRRNPTLPESNPAGTDKSSTRVLQRPGGKQSVVIGDTRQASPVKNGRRHGGNETPRRNPLTMGLHANGQPVHDQKSGFAKPAPRAPFDTHDTNKPDVEPAKTSIKTTCAPGGKSSMGNVIQQKLSPNGVAKGKQAQRKHISPAKIQTPVRRRSGLTDHNTKSKTPAKAASSIRVAQAPGGRSSLQLH